MTGDIEQGGSGGLSRRQMIKASAVAGAAAWTAPMIIDSLTSPAAALTPLVGCHTASFNSSCGDDQHSQCASTDCPVNNVIAACLTRACFGTGNDKYATVTNNCPTCTITFAKAAHGNDCTPAVINGNQASWFTIQDNYDQYYVALTCT